MMPELAKLERGEAYVLVGNKMVVAELCKQAVLAKKIESLQGENNVTLNVKDLPSGTYFLKMENGFENTVQKFMVW
ncbi:MAG: T9SS type A sorting domain-containing protein [Chitinophagales bacterium]